MRSQLYRHVPHVFIYWLLFFSASSNTTYLSSLLLFFNTFVIFLNTCCTKCLPAGRINYLSQITPRPCVQACVDQYQKRATCCNSWLYWYPKFLEFVIFEICKYFDKIMLLLFKYIYIILILYIYKYKYIYINILLYIYIFFFEFVISKLIYWI